MKDILKNFISTLSLRQRRGFQAAFICLVLIASLSLMICIKKNSLYDQTVAQRWSDKKDSAQLTCFYPATEALDDYYFQNLEHTIEKALTDASVGPANEHAKLFADAVSTRGEITIESDSASYTLQAMGITNDFFLFHPISLLYGSYFGGDDLMQDGIILDEDAAWQLFGSNDIVGMQVTIGGIPHYITGVTSRSEGRFDKAAGLNKSLCYISLDSLKKYGTVQGSYTYEIVMPDPVKDFARTTIQTALKDDENRIEVVENSSRFHILPLMSVIKNFGIRSMNQRGILYPYWENRARAYEDVFAAEIFIILTATVVFGVLTLLFVIGKWRHKTISIHTELKKWILCRFEYITEHNRKTKENHESVKEKNRKTKEKKSRTKEQNKRAESENKRES